MGFTERPRSDEEVGRRATKAALPKTCSISRFVTLFRSLTCSIIQSTKYVRILLLVRAHMEIAWFFLRLARFSSCGCRLTFYAPTSSPPPATTSGWQLADAESNPTTPTCQNESLFATIRQRPQNTRLAHQSTKTLFGGVVAHLRRISWQVGGGREVALLGCLELAWTLILARSTPYGRKREEGEGEGEGAARRPLCEHVCVCQPHFRYIPMG